MRKRMSIIVLLIVMALMSGCSLLKTGERPDLEDKLIVYDFEGDGEFTWEAGSSDSGVYASVTVNSDPQHVREGNISGKFTVTKPDPDKNIWVSYQFQSKGKWTADNWDKDGNLCIWVKGDGSPQKFEVGIFDNSRGFVYYSTVQFDVSNKHWQKFEFPFSTFKTRSWEGNDSMVDTWDLLNVYAIRVSSASAPTQGCTFYIDSIEVDSI
jgi:hypothetical protein